MEPPHGFVLERLDPVLHDRQAFRCASEPLDVFLKTQALQAQVRNLSSTHVVAVEGARPARIAGFVTLAGMDLPFHAVPERVARRLRLKRGSVPALLIGRLATDLEFEHRGIGGFLLKFSLAKAVDIADTAGCALVVVDAKDGAASFYEHFGFQRLEDPPTRLIYSVADIRELVKAWTPGPSVATR